MPKIVICMLYITIYVCISLVSNIESKKMNKMNKMNIIVYFGLSQSISNIYTKVKVFNIVDYNYNNKELYNNGQNEE